MKILAIESSCDETSVSVLDGDKILCNKISSQIEIHKEFGGVIPEIASRYHIQNISYIFEEALDEAKIKMEEIDYIAVTTNPGLKGALLVGEMFARGLSKRYNKPLIGVNHILGHICSNFIENELIVPSLHLVASGGHTSLYYIDENKKVKLIGQTQDDAIGEAFDKIARVLNLEYPGGPKIDKRAKEYSGDKTFEIDIKIPKIDNLDFSFSGIKTKVINYINKKKMKNEKIDVDKICYEVEERMIDIIIDKLKLALTKYEIKALYVGGGVSANYGLRKRLENGFENRPVFYPSLKYCTDNAAMIAMACKFMIKENYYEI